MTFTNEIIRSKEGILIARAMPKQDIWKLDNQLEEKEQEIAINFSQGLWGITMYHYRKYKMPKYYEVKSQKVEN